MADVQRELLAKAIDGDKDALSQLFAIHGPEIEKTLHIERTWRAQIDSSDVMQVTYLEAFNRIREFDLGRADRFEGWLRQMAENNLRDAIRGLTSQKRGGAAKRSGGGDSEIDELSKIAAVCATPSRIVRRGEKTSQLHKALSRLPPEYARVVQMMDIDGKPVAEAAKALGRSHGAVHMLRARALERLRELLGPPSSFLSS